MFLLQTGFSKPASIALYDLKKIMPVFSSWLKYHSMWVIASFAGFFAISTRGRVVLNYETFVVANGGALFTRAGVLRPFPQTVRKG